ncbi:MAG: DUF2497 domain-containing protein, partial [Pseudomonadota bacterium]
MGDISAEPSMEDILSSIKRIIAEDGDAQPRARRTPRPVSVVGGPRADDTPRDEVLELSDPAPVTVESPDHDEPAAADPIVSTRAAAASRGSLDALTRMIARPEPEA